MYDYLGEERATAVSAYQGAPINSGVTNSGA